MAALAETPLEAQLKEIAGLLRVLANENRLRILCELLQGTKTVGGLGAKLPHISQPALSQHLALLKAHGILSSAKNGQSVVYAIADSRMAEIISVLRKHYCPDQQQTGPGHSA